jgi:hypothetical protein
MSCHLLGTLVLVKLFVLGSKVCLVAEVTTGLLCWPSAVMEPLERGRQSVHRIRPQHHPFLEVHV